MKRFLCFALSLTLLLLCGCGQSDSYTPTGDALMPEDYSGPAITAPPSQEQQALVLAYYPNITMNPYQCTEFTNRALFSLLYQGLFAINRSYQAEPILCKQFSVSQDLTQYTFYLENATFSDGSRLTGQDVAASYQAARESVNYKGRFLHITDVIASGDTVTISLDTPMEDLPLLLDIPIVKAGQVAVEKPVGTGPYYMTGNGAVATLQKRTDWWCTAVNMQFTSPTIALVKAESPTQTHLNFPI